MSCSLLSSIWSAEAVAVQERNCRRYGLRPHVSQRMQEAILECLCESGISVI